MNPGVPLVIWADEDTPLIWPEVLQAVSGHDDATELEDTDELLAGIMSPDGLVRMRNYVATHPPRSILQRRRIVSAFLDKFALPDRVEMEFDMPGWTRRHGRRNDRRPIDEDIDRIRAMPGDQLHLGLSGAARAGAQLIPSAALYISSTASSSAISSGLRLRSAMTLRITLVS